MQDKGPNDPARTPQGTPDRADDATPGAADEREAATTSRLRDDIDEGRTGDKVGYPDPAASPLGTDAEAAGAPPTREEVATARDRETGARETAPVADSGRPVSVDRHTTGRSRGGLIAGIIAVVVLILLLWMVF